MIPAGTKVYFALAPADLRRSFDGLSALAMAELERNPAEGGLFVFVNKRGNQVRVLFRDRHGCCILAKRLDRGRFRRPQQQDGRVCWEMEAPRLMELLEDIDMSRAQARVRAQTKAQTKQETARHLKIVKRSDS